MRLLLNLKGLCLKLIRFLKSPILIGNVIVNFSQAVFDGLLIFCSPYYYLMECSTAFWKDVCHRNSRKVNNSIIL